MNTALQALLKEWRYIRGLTKSFVTGLEEDALDRELPRKTLNTLRKHCEELLAVQRCYVVALETGSIAFDGYQDATLPGDTSRAELLKAFDELDAQLVERIKQHGDQKTINWFGEEESIYAHLAAMISHESMHVGQMVAFCYATGITIPGLISKTMALSS